MSERLRGGCAALSMAAALLLLSGCAAVPADPDGTLERVNEGDLRVGITHNPPWTEIRGTGSPSGHEVRLVQRFARSQGADVRWTVASEAVLVDALSDGDLDLVIGGFIDDTPWTDKAAITAPFRESEVDGRVEKHVMLAPLGENRFLVTLEEFLHEQEATP